MKKLILIICLLAVVVFGLKMITSDVVPDGYDIVAVDQVENSENGELESSDIISGSVLGGSHNIDSYDYNFTLVTAKIMVKSIPNALPPNAVGYVVEVK